MKINQTEQYKTLRNLMPAVCGLVDDDRAGLVQYAIEHGHRIIHETVLSYGTGEDMSEIFKAMEHLGIKPIEGERCQWDAVPAHKLQVFPNQYTTPEAMNAADAIYQQMHIRREVLFFLMKKAFTGQTTTYQELATEFSLPTTGNQLGSSLAPILRDLVIWCQERNVPPISALVVRKSGGDAGLPGSGFWPMVGLEGLNRYHKQNHTKQLHKQIFNYFSFVELV